MKKRWILLGRLHINGRNRYNSWKYLSNYLNIKLEPIENTKALALTSISISQIKKKLEKYNKQHHTDFFVE